MSDKAMVHSGASASIPVEGGAGRFAELIARLEAAEVGSRELDGAMHRLVYPNALLMTDAGSVAGRDKRPARYEPIGKLPNVPDLCVSECMADVHQVTTSLDAALALAELALPGCVWEIRIDAGGAVVQCDDEWWVDGYIAPDVGGVYVEAKTPALALCTAILKALEAKQ